MTIRKSACRVGGGDSAGCSRSVSPTPRARVPAVISMAGRYRGSIAVPILRQSQRSCGGQFNQRQGLLTFRDQHIVARPQNLERAPKSHTLEAIQPTFDNKMVAESRRAPRID